MAQDYELLKICANFRVADEDLNRLVGCSDEDLPEYEFMVLHDRWSQALLRAAALSARTADGVSAKAAVLLAAMAVVLGPNFNDAAPHELLAVSLARDLTS